MKWSILIILLCATTALSTQLPSDVKEITKNVYSFSTTSPVLLNSIFIVTSRGVIAIEPYNSQHAEKFVAAIKEVTNKKIKYLLISHNHWDHASGGKVFKDEGATVMAHKEAVDWMLDNPNNDLYIPDRPWNGRKCNIRLGGARVDLHYFGINHGLGMSVFVYKPPFGHPKQNVAFISDLVSAGTVFFGPIPDANMKESLRTYREILKLKFEKVVLTHSALEKSSKESVRENLKLGEDLKAEVAKALAEGKNLVLQPELLQLPQYKHLGRYEEDFPKNVQKFALEFFIGPYPWRSVKKYMGPQRRKPNPWRKNSQKRGGDRRY